MLNYSYLGFHMLKVGVGFGWIGNWIFDMYAKRWRSIPPPFLQNPIISKLYILKPELTPKILCETDRILLTILKILFIIRKNAIYYGGIMIETKRYN